MDRLSSYAAREADLESNEDRKQAEEQAATELLERLRISKEHERPQAMATTADGKQMNGEQINGDKPTEAPSSEIQGQPNEDSKHGAASENGDKTTSGKSRGIPKDVKLYEIFYEQVVNLVNAQRLHIQDTIALLVSLAKLAL